ncbi:MAG: NUDIX hydrolase, partial [Gammaproteobacteria bacterium]
MKYCSDCGEPVTEQIPAGDNRPRFVCCSCATVHYQNPKVVAGCLVEWNGRVLLCKRAIEPRYGFWTLPAGFMELGETTLEAAVRETREEALAEISVDGLFTVLN